MKVFEYYPRSACVSCANGYGSGSHAGEFQPAGFALGDEALRSRGSTVTVVPIFIVALAIAIGGLTFCGTPR